MKITPTTLINTVLAGVLLSSILFIGLTGSAGVYDPYADYDADGDIDIFDVVPMAEAYGTTGDPTRNVTVINLPVDENGCLRVTMPKTISHQIGCVAHVIYENSVFKSGEDKGTYLHGELSIEAGGYFSYLPDEVASNVTAIGVSVLAIPSGLNDFQPFRFNITLNDNATARSQEVITRDNDPKSLCTVVPNLGFLQTISEGLNKLMIDGPERFDSSIDRWVSAGLEVFKIEVLIEYEYLCMHATSSMPCSVKSVFQN